MSINWRLASRLSVIIMALLVIAVVTLIDGNRAGVPNLPGTNQSGLQGTDLGNTPAPGFTLTDQFGKQIALSQFKGKPTILTFLYTSCPDQCPLTAEKLHTTMLSLGNDAKNVGVLAVSTDPIRDNTAAALKFSKAHNMQNYWHFLVDTKEKLSAVWSSYDLYVQPDQQTVSHSLGLFIIDKKGNERVFLGSDFTPAQLAATLKVLLKEP